MDKLMPSIPYIWNHEIYEPLAPFAQLFLLLIYLEPKTFAYHVHHFIIIMFVRIQLTINRLIAFFKLFNKLNEIFLIHFWRIEVIMAR